MAKRTSMRLDDDLQMLEDRARAELDSILPPERYRTDLYKLALQNLLDTIENHAEYDGPPSEAKRFNTRVVRSRYSYSMDVNRP